MDKEPSAQVSRWRAFAVLAVSFFMTVVDLTIVNVALPTIGRDLHFSESNMQWVVTPAPELRRDCAPSQIGCCTLGVKLKPTATGLLMILTAGLDAVGPHLLISSACPWRLDG